MDTTHYLCVHGDNGSGHATETTCKTVSDDGQEIESTSAGLPIVRDRCSASRGMQVDSKKKLIRQSEVRRNWQTIKPTRPVKDATSPGDGTSRDTTNEHVVQKELTSRYAALEKVVRKIEN